MNTWDESLASCSAPQENQYNIDVLFPRESISASPVSPSSLHVDQDGSSPHGRSAKRYRYGNAVAAGAGRLGAHGANLEFDEEDEIEEEELPMFGTPQSGRDRRGTPIAVNSAGYRPQYREDNDCHYY